MGPTSPPHIDLFEKLITQISYNDPLHPPSEEQKIDWFLDSITERTYDSVKTTCSAENIEGKLTFEKMVKLFTHNCFQRYPDFHIRELVNPKDKSTLTNNSTTILNRGRHGNGRGRGKGQHQNNSYGQQNKGQKGQRAPKGKGKGKPNGFKGQAKRKGKTHSRPTGNRNSTPCGYCQKPGHEARECRKRLYDEKQKTTPTVTNNSQHPTHLHVDETTLMVSSNAVFAYPCEDENGENMDQQEWQDTHDGDDNTDDQQVDALADEVRTHRFSWRLQMEPSFLTIRVSGPDSNAYHAEEVETLQPNPTPPQTTTTDLIMDNIMVPTIQTNTTPPVPPTSGEQNESSSVEQPDSTTVSPPWGAYTQEITPVDLWLAPTPLTQPQYLHRQCSICEAAMATLDSQAILTCHNCKM